MIKVSYFVRQGVKMKGKILIIYFFITCQLIAQQRMIFHNNVYAVINNSCYLVVDNPNANALTTSNGGNILTENEYNVVKWNISNSVGKYTVPFTTSTFVKIPLTLNITNAGSASSGSVGIVFSTFPTQNDDNTYYASDVTNMNSSCNQNNGLYAIDRFWRIDASDYSVKPSVIIDAGYNDAIHELGASNTINEKNLKLERFNAAINSWETPLKLYGTCNPTTNVVAGATISPVDFKRTWTLIDESVMTSTVQIGVNQPSVCPGINTLIKPVGGKNYTVQAISSVISPSVGLSFNVIPVTTTSYNVIGTDSTSCRLTPFMGTVCVVTVLPKPKSGFNISPDEVDEDEPLINITSLAGNVTTTSYQLSDGASYFSPDVSHVLKDLDKNVSVVFQVVNNAYGCSDTSSQSVKVKRAFTIFIPNAFTPNHDGLNDFFEAKGVGITEFYMDIFDAWGHLVFHSGSLTEKWNGKTEGGTEIFKQDVYTWKVKVKDIRNKWHYLSGHVVVLP